MTARVSGILIGLVLAAAGIGIAVYSAGGGHGTYVPAVGLFPLAMLTTVLTGGVITPVAIALAVVQFPFYGFVCGSVQPGRRSRVLVAIALAHVILVVSAFMALNAAAQFSGYL